MSSEQIRLFAKGKEALLKKDIDFIKQQVDVTMGPSTDSTRQAIMLNLDRLTRHAGKISAMCDTEEKIRKEMLDYKQKLQDLLEGADRARKDLNANTDALNKENQRLTILKSLKEFASLKSDVLNSLKDLAFRKAAEQMTRMQQISSLIHFDKQMQTCREEWIRIVQSSYPQALSMKNNSFNMAELHPLALVLQQLDMCSGFVDFFFEYLERQFLPQLAKCKTDLNRDRHAFSIAERKEKNNPGKFLSTAIELLQQIMTILEHASFTIPDARLAEYANTAFSIGLSLPGGQANELEASAREMCVVTKTEMIDVTRMIRGSRLPSVLGKCRELLNEGKPFADVVKTIKAMMEGTDDSGVLKEVALLATVVWQKDWAKLEGCVPTLISIGSRDAFEAAMVIDKYVQEKRQ